MSSLFGFNEGAINSTVPLLIPNAATDNDIITPGASTGQSGIVLSHINFAIGSASTITLKVFDPATATSYFLINGQVQAANTVFIYEFPYLLRYGWTLRAQASVLNQVTVTATYVAYPKASGTMR